MIHPIAGQLVRGQDGSTALGMTGAICGTELLPFGSFFQALLGVAVAGRTNASVPIPLFAG